MRATRARFLSVGFTATALAALLAACSSGGSGGSGNNSSKQPILIGASVSLTGDFSADGQAFQRGYNLWAADVNKAGGLLGRQVKMVYLDDKSDPTQGSTNVQQFDPIVTWIKALPSSQRPKTAAYPIIDNPFTIPPEQRTQKALQTLGVKTVYSKVLPAELPNAKSVADQVAAAKADAVFLGSVDVPTVAAFMQAFAQQHYNPKIFAATAGPDQGAAFLKAVGTANATGVMTANGWYGGYDNSQSKQMVSEYIAKFGGTPSDINSDVAEGYGVGQVAAQAIKATGGTNQAKIISYLHSGVTLSSVQGPVQFDSLGMNIKPVLFVFQWQDGKYAQVLPVGAPGSSKILFPKPNWAS